MNENQALAMAAELASAYPGRGVGELTMTQYAQAFMHEERETVVYAIGDLVRQFPDRAPTLGQVDEALRIRRPSVQPEITAHQDVGYGQRFLPPDVISHGVHHAHRYLAGSKDDREPMREPWNCACEWSAGLALSEEKEGA